VFYPVTTQTQTSPGPFALAVARLAADQDIVSFCRRTRAAGERFGLDEHAALGLAAGTYELVRVMLELGATGEVELGIGEGPALQVLVRVRGATAEEEPLTQVIRRLRPMVHELSISTTDSQCAIRLAAPIASPAPEGVSGVVRQEGFEDRRRDVDGDSARESQRQRTLDDLRSELQETNRGVVALYGELDDSAERLREAEDRLRLLLDSVQDYAICMLTTTGEVASWSAGAERLFRFSPEDIIGHTFARFYSAREREAGIPEAHIRKANANNRSESEDVVLRSDGSSFNAHVLVTPVYGPSQEARGFSLVVHDVTERKRLEGDLRRRADELAAANRAKEDFLATLSHELRTPLNAMLGWTRLLRMGKLDAAGVERALETVERNARLQEQLIADILDVSRIVTGKLRLQLRPLKLAPVIDAAVDALRPAADAKGVRLETSLQFSGNVLGDSDRLQQVVWNLLSNAIKFTPRGGEVAILLERKRGSAIMTVTDTGEGIAADLLPFVFDRFRQGDASATRPHGGLGLGLSIVRHIVELHGGRVQAASVGRNGGASFSLSLPIRNASSSRR
jgi:PAS domain S-box-containing protein